MPPTKTNVREISENDKRSVRRFLNIGKKDVKYLAKLSDVSQDEFYDVHYNTFTKAKGKKKEVNKQMRMVDNRQRQTERRNFNKMIQETKFRIEKHEMIAKIRSDENDKKVQKYNVSCKVYVRKQFCENGVWGEEFIEQENDTFEIVSSRLYLDKDVNERLTTHFRIRQTYFRADAIIDELHPVQISIINITEFSNKKKDIKKIRMKEAAPLKMNFINGVDEVSLQKTEMECVYVALHKRYSSIKKRYKTADDFYRMFNEYYRSQNVDSEREDDDEDNNKFNNLDRKSGVDSEMLLYACQKFDITFMAFDIKNNMYLKHLSKNQNLPALVIYNVGEHMYMITDQKVIKSLVKKNSNNNQTNHKSCVVHYEEKEHQDLPVFDYTTLEELEKVEAPSIAIIYTSDLMDVFKEIIKTRWEIPKVQNKGERTIKSIEYVRKDGKIVYIQKDANYGIQLNKNHKLNYHDIKKQCEILKIPFANQGIGSLVKTYYDDFRKLKSGRIDIDRKLFFAQKGCECVKCGSEDKIQIDHIIPLSAGGTNDISNLQPLCTKCHFHKSKEEQETDQYVNIDPIKSSFNNKTRKMFISDLMKKNQFVQRLGDYKSKYGYDICRCRKNNLYYSKYEFPVYSVMDDIEDFDGKTKCGFYFVKSENTYPLRGNGWYSQPMVEYCIEVGIQIEIIYQFVPSMKLDCDYFQDFIDVVYSKFGELSKLAINSFIGTMYNLGSKRLMNTTNSGVYTRSKDEAIYAYAKYDGSFVRYEEDLGLYQILFSKNTINDETEAPIYNYILDMEAMETHKLAQLVGNASMIKTDCIYSENDVDISKYEWAAGVPKYKREAVNDDITEILPNLQRTELYVNEKKKFNKIMDREDFQDLARQAIKLGSCQINGRAGVGKTYLTKSILEELRNMGYGDYLNKEDKKNKNYICLAPTNKAARNVKGVTLHKFVGRGCRKVTEKLVRNIDYMVIDEISMMSELFYKVLISIKNIKPEMKFVLVGDFGQLKPVRDRADFNYKYSRALYELCNGNRIELSICRRSDDVLFNLCKNISKVDISNFGKRTDLHKNICFTNNKRKEINKKCMEEFNKNKKHIKVKALEWDSNSQDMMISVGTPLIARRNYAELEIANNDSFEVIALGHESIIIDDGSENGLEIMFDMIAKLFHVAFCITCHKAQGETFDCEYTIHEWAKMDKVLKYVALSRATDIKNIHIIA